MTPPLPAKPDSKKGEGGLDYVKRVLSASDALIAALAAAGAFDVLGGVATVEELSAEIKRLVDLQRSDPIAFLQSPLLLPERLRLRILLNARTSMLDQAVAERTQRPGLTILMGVGAIAAALGAGIFAFVTNQAEQVEADAQRALKRTEAIEDLDRARTEALEDRDAARIVSGDLLPKSSSPVRIVIPAGTALDAITSELTADTGAPCDIAVLTGTLVEIATPPEGPPTRVMRVVTPTTSACTAGDLWLEPAWVIPAPVAPSTPPTTAGSGD